MLERLNAYEPAMSELPMLETPDSKAADRKLSGNIDLAILLGGENLLDRLLAAS